MGSHPSRGKRLTVLIDSQSWVEFFAGTKIGEKVKAYVTDADQEIVISSITLAEIYRLALDRFDEQTAEKRRGDNDVRMLPNPCGRRARSPGSKAQAERWGVWETH